MLKICLDGKCKGLKMVVGNGFPSRCTVQAELGHEIPVVFPIYNIELSLPAELATLLEIGRSLTITLEQNGN
jgi:hypothetical protein